ncbi:MAG: S-layer homology domain-containing protein [Candidatus Peregrinibacteria bacterium]
MKKFLLILSIATFSALAIVSDALALDTNSWYIYNGYSTLHSFSVKFPTDWQARTFGDDLQGFAPKDIFDDTYFLIREFEGGTYSQAVDYYTDENTEAVKIEDAVFSNGDDLIGKIATYKNNTTETEEEFQITFIKRGSLILAMNNPVEGKYFDILEEIYNSLSFTDGWFQYIDFGDGYAFIFPSILDIENLNNGVALTDPQRPEVMIFSGIKYGNTAIDEAPEKGEGYNESLKDAKSILFHGIDTAVLATYYDSSEKKNFSRIFVEKDGSSYGLTNVNISSDFPHPNYYDEYIVEILESFEFFDVDGEYYSYLYFPDVRENHQNELSIDSLVKDGIIEGYPDGTFRPDGEINRAELTKMIVASKISPSPEKYNNCFPDVKDEWFAPFICYAKEQGWVEGYQDGKFKPERNINRVEALKIILEALITNIAEESLKNTSVADIGQTEWYRGYFNFADNRNLLDKQHVLEDGEAYYYYPGENITRKEVAETIYRIRNLQ